MTLDEAAYVVSEIKYKDWHIDALHGGDDTDSLELRTCFLAPCAVIGDYSSTKKLPVVQRSLLSRRCLETLDERNFLKWVFSNIMQMEKHEAEEWFRYRDEAILDPHADRPKLVFTGALSLAP